MNLPLADTLSSFSLSLAATAVFMVFAAYAMFRSFTRLVINTLALAVCSAAAWYAWRQAPGLSAAWLGKPVPYLPVTLATAAFVISWVAIKKIIHLVFVRDCEQERFSFSPLKLVFAAIPSLLVWLLAASFILNHGATEEVRSFSRNFGKERKPKPEFGVRLKDTLQDWLPASWSRRIAPVADPARVNLAKLVAAQSKDPYEPVTDPATGEPIPRAIPVDDPELTGLAGKGRFAALLRHPSLSAILAEPEVREFLRKLRL